MSGTFLDTSVSTNLNSGMMRAELGLGYGKQVTIQDLDNGNSVKIQTTMLNIVCLHVDS